MPNTQQLRVGLITDSLKAPSWVRYMIDQIRKSDAAEISVVVHLPGPTSSHSKVGRILKNHRSVLYELYRKADRKMFKVRPDAFLPGNLTENLQQVPIHTFQSPVLSNGSRSTEVNRLLELLKQAKVDLLVRIGSPEIPNEVFEVLPCGVWSLSHGDPETQRGGPAGIWEVFQNSPSIGSALQMDLGDTRSPVVLAKTHSCTDWISINRTLKACYWKSLSLVPRQLQELKRLGREGFLENAANRVPPLKANESRRTPAPGNLEMLRIGTRMAGRFLGRKWRDLWKVAQWQLLVKRGNDLSFAMSEFDRLIPPKGQFWADPTLIVKDGKPYLFFEACSFSDYLGHICVLTTDASGRWNSEPEIVLRRPYHLSYPFIFQWQGSYYMMPETSENKTVEVYRCVEFPNVWKLEKTLMSNIVAVDATLHEREGRWWMFANVSERDGASSWDELHLFSSDSPLSTDWKPHPKNPVISDVRCARPGGAIFQHQGRWIRPAQDCSGHYGRGLKFLEIVKLSPTEYQERELTAVYPEWDPRVIAVHSYARSGEWMASDAMYLRSKYWND